MSEESKRYILALSCNDVRGIVAAVTAFVAQKDGFILESTQFGDPSTKQFFLRMELEAGPKTPEYEALKAAFEQEVGAKYGMHFELHPKESKPKLVIMVSKTGHCLYDLLHRYRSGKLPVEIPAVISNHDDLRGIVEWHGIPFHYFPITSDTKEAQEAKVWDVFEQSGADLLVLARYMQILSADLCEKLVGRAINIHHSFLPSFKGARPYHQAFDRGVKIIGATAHYVTGDLDEGPIIEQEVVRVSHNNLPDDLVTLGHDIERTVLAKAVKLHTEHRVILNDHKTVVFQ